ncbi:MAG: Fic family protein [Pseudomonadota bacterium]
MILFDLTQSEANPAYQKLQVSNLDRQYDFLRSIVDASIEMERPYLSQAVIKAFNYHAIVCLHSDAGVFRRSEVKLSDQPDAHKPPMSIYVQGLVDDFVNQVNYNLQSTDSVTLATWALWRLNWIHPFVNGNGRTARLVAYYIICIRAGGMIKGQPSLPELLREHRNTPDDPYVAALRAADRSLINGRLDLKPLHDFVTNCLGKQLASQMPVPPGVDAGK